MKLDDGRVRAAAFAFLEEQTQAHGEVLSWTSLLEGFQLGGRRVPLTSQQGIFRPAVLAEMPLTIRTAPAEAGKARPYDDAVGSDGLMLYRYRGTDPEHRENVGLRLAMQRQAPLVYLFGIVEGQYMPVWPVYVVGDDPVGLSFKIAFDARELSLGSSEPEVLRLAEPRRAYVTRLTLQRVHQRTFAQRVLLAYQNRCAMCRLAHPELLDAAHILPDGHPRGLPITPNGLALCKIHHAAFDRHILGIRPDHVIEVRRDILEEVDGPMLLHGIQAMAGQRLNVPRAETSRPARELLEERYEMFRRAG
jgi:putative restriction endonuclease